MENFAIDWSRELSRLGGALLVLGLTTLIGWDRERQRRPAGLRTHLIVGIASWLFITLGIRVASQFETTLGVNADPLRMVQALIEGVAFIGAGTIFVSGASGKIQGITTAASLLATAAVGVAVALGEVVLAVVVALAVFMILTLMSRLEARIQASTSTPEERAARLARDDR